MLRLPQGCGGHSNERGSWPSRHPQGKGEKDIYPNGNDQGMPKENGEQMLRHTDRRAIWEEFSEGRLARAKPGQRGAGCDWSMSCSDWCRGR